MLMPPLILGYCLRFMDLWDYHTAQLLGPKLTLQHPHRSLSRLLVEDLNSTSLDCMRTGLRHSHNSNKSSQAFRTAVNNLGLIDLGSSSGKFTWRNGCRGLGFSRARLDQAISNGTWRQLLPSFYVCLLPTTLSDHNPFLIDLKDKDKNIKFFHLSTIIRQNWNHISVIKDDSGSLLCCWEDIGTAFLNLLSTTFSIDEYDSLEDLEDLVQPCLKSDLLKGISSIPSRVKLKS